MQFDTRLLSNLGGIIPVILAVILAIVGVVAGVGTGDRNGNSSIPDNISVGGTTAAKIDQQDLVDATNAWRIRNNVPALPVSEKLNADAQAWADYMARTNDYRHSERENYTSNGVTLLTTENISKTSSPRSADAQVQIWHGSKDGHKENQLFVSHSEFGVGVDYTPTGVMYAVQIFAYEPSHHDAFIASLPAKARQ